MSRGDFTGQSASAGPRRDRAGVTSRRLRTLTIMGGVLLAFGAVSGQLVRLAARADQDMSVTQAQPVAKAFARPDIIDRNGRLIATDIAMPSLFADPLLVQSRDQVAEALESVLPDLDVARLRRDLAEPGRRFVWVRRGLSPRLAQRIHDLGLPGLAFKDELRRAYPMGSLAGHVIGGVNIDNKGVSGIERYIDEAVGVEGVHGATLTVSGPVRLALDVGVQHSLEDELATAMRRYHANGAAGLVMEVRSGEILASASLPGVDPSLGETQAAPERDRVAGGTFELGSVFKLMTVAMVLDQGLRGTDSIVDVTEPLVAGRHTIEDSHPVNRPLTVAEIFTHSSNIGAGILALEAGAERHQAFLARLGLTTAMSTERGPVALPQLPRQLGRAEQITLSYGHGLAVAPLQFAAAAAALINGGTRVKPTFMAGGGVAAGGSERVISAAASERLRELMRANVAGPVGTGKRADVPGYEVGGKTGTAEIPVKGGYSEKRVIASFVGAFPMSEPRYLVLVSLFEPHGSAETGGDVLAGTNAAPTAGRIIARIAPQLGLMPKGAVAALGD